MGVGEQLRGVLEAIISISFAPGQHGEHEYSIEEFGLTSEQVHEKLEV